MTIEGYLFVAAIFLLTYGLSLLITGELRKRYHVLSGYVASLLTIVITGHLWQAIGTYWTPYSHIQQYAVLIVGSIIYILLQRYTLRTSWMKSGIIFALSVFLPILILLLLELIAIIWFVTVFSL